MKKFIKRVLGIDKIELAAEVALQAKLKEQLAVEETIRLAKLTPKERATEKEESYIAVLDTKVNKDNVRNGFFELDWNAEFVVQLKQAGYGFDGDPEEEIVDRWFKDLARNVLADEGQDINRGAGFINVNKLAGGKAEVK
jgi:hypothetical protein